jgi:hypothetical protein
MLKGKDGQELIWEVPFSEISWWLAGIAKYNGVKVERKRENETRKGLEKLKELAKLKGY